MAQLPVLQWNMGTVHTFTADTSDNPVNILTSISQSVVSSSYWKVTNSAISSASFPSLIIAPTSTSASYTHQRIIFITGRAPANVKGPRHDGSGDWPGDTDMQFGDADIPHVSYSPYLYIGYAPFAGETSEASVISIGSDGAGAGDWRTITPYQNTSARFSGWHSVITSNASAAAIQATKVYIIEGEESIFFHFSSGFASNITNEGLVGAGALFVAHSDESVHSGSEAAGLGRCFGIQAGTKAFHTSYIPFGPATADIFEETAVATHGQYWPSQANNTAYPTTYGHRTYFWHSGSTSWHQVATEKLGNSHLRGTLTPRDVCQKSQYYDYDGEYVVKPMYIHLNDEPYTAVGYWRQMTQCGKVFARQTFYDASAAVMGYSLQKMVAPGDREGEGSHVGTMISSAGYILFRNTHFT
jgi:hypothetical protein